jgi:hypothetical protein
VAKFFWDASAEKLELSNLKLYSDNVRNEGNTLYIGTSGNNPTQFYNNDANTVYISGTGNVGIGTSSPGTTLDVIGPLRSNVSGGTPIVYLSNGTTQHSIQNTSDALTFFNNATEAMRIDSSGRVGIGTSSPQSTYKLTISGTDSVFPSVYLENTTNSKAYSMRATGTSWIIRDNTVGADRLNIDSSGNVGIGTSSPSALLQLEGSDGTPQLKFLRTGTNIGGIIRQTSSPYGLTYDAIDGNAGAPTHVFRTSVDGSSFTERMRIDAFKDLYLSGGVYLGGTGSANLLEDYEVGSFTPSFTASTTAPTIAYNTQTASYTKIGNTVTYTIFIVTNSRSGGSGNLSVTGLPFTVATGQDYGSTIGFNYNWETGGNPLYAFAQGSTTGIILYKSANNEHNESDDILASGNSYLRLTGFYYTTG